MKMISSVVVLAIFFVLVFQVKAQQTPNSGVIIVDDTGSTNFSGYRMVIDPSGRVAVMAHGKASLNVRYANGFYTVSPVLVKNLIQDLKAQMPFSKLKPVFCAKSRSFGTETYVTYKGQTSPDIQCMNNSEKFVKDVDLIMQAVPRPK